MEKIKITFLGTADAIPTKKRSHSSILLSYKNENILIDCGEGAQRQFKIAELSPMKLTKILITHWHGDHTLGLLGLIETLIMQEYKKTLEIYGPKGTLYYMNLLLQFLSPYKRFRKIKIQIKEVTEKFLETEEFYIEVMPMSHGIPTNAYSFVIKDKLRIDKEKLKKLKLPNCPLLKKLREGKDITISGKKIKSSSVTYKEKGRKITFVLDTELNKNMEKIAKNSDLLICESSFSEKDEALAKEYAHLTSAQVAKVAKKAKVKKLIITHVSQRYEKNLNEIEKEAQKIFPSTRMARDFDVVEV